MPEYVDVAIPRGGERLIRAMCEAALVPVLLADVALVLAMLLADVLAAGRRSE